MFLMVNCWRSTSRLHVPAARLADTLCHAAVSITITSLTDALSFAVGSLIPLPAVRIFCVFSALAITFTFLYQMTFFLAIMVYQGQREWDLRHCVFGFSVLLVENMPKVSAFTKMTRIGSSLPWPPEANNSRSAALVQRRPWHRQFLEDCYAPFLTRPLVQLVTLTFFLAYVTGAVLGIFRLRIGFEIENLLAADSPSLAFVNNRLKFYGDLDGKKMEIIVNNPPNLAFVSEREKFFRVLQAFEQTPFSTGRKDTEFWFFAYENFLETLGFQLPDDNSLHFHQHLRPFLLSKDFFNYDVIWNKNKTGIKTFRLRIGMNGTETNKEKIAAAKVMRSIAANYREYNITTYTFIWRMADQFETVVPQTLQNIGIALTSMSVISLLLIPQPFCSIAVAGSIISIDVGVLGYMTWWGVNLDCISMITIIMSVGFSVDFAAHITYGYIAKSPDDNKSRSPEQCLKASMGKLAYPLVQGAVSTILGIAALSTVNAYITQTFFKTIFLVISLGTLHAILFLPVTLVASHRIHMIKNENLRCQCFH